MSAEMPNYADERIAELVKELDAARAEVETYRASRDPRIITVLVENQRLEARLAEADRLLARAREDRDASAAAARQYGADLAAERLKWREQENRLQESFANFAAKWRVSHRAALISLRKRCASAAWEASTSNAGPVSEAVLVVPLEEEP